MRKWKRQEKTEGVKDKEDEEYGYEKGEYSEGEAREMED